MTLLDRLLRPAHDDHAAVRPLWLAVVAEAREPRWYRELGVADTIEGRFDMITLVLALVLLRLERDRSEDGARLTELFVEDMDAQLRQSGVGDLMVGKHVGKLMAVLGGRLGALREGLAQDEAALTEVVARNVTLREEADTASLARALRALHRRIDAVSNDALRDGSLS